MTRRGPAAACQPPPAPAPAPAPPAGSGYASGLGPGTPLPASSWVAPPCQLERRRAAQSA